MHREVFKSRAPHRNHVCRLAGCPLARVYVTYSVSFFRHSSLVGCDFTYLGVGGFGVSFLLVGWLVGWSCSSFYRGKCSDSGLDLRGAGGVRSAGDMTEVSRGAGGVRSAGDMTEVSRGAGWELC